MLLPTSSSSSSSPQDYPPKPSPINSNHSIALTKFLPNNSGNSLCIAQSNQYAIEIPLGNSFEQQLLKEIRVGVGGFGEKLGPWEVMDVLGEIKIFEREGRNVGSALGMKDKLWKRCVGDGNGVVGRVGVVREVLGILVVEEVGVVEVEGVCEGQVELCGVLWGKGKEVWKCSVGLGVVVGKVLGGCWIRRVVWEGMKRRVINSYRVERFGSEPELEDIGGGGINTEVGGGWNGRGDSYMGTRVVKAWDLGVDDVLEGSDEYLRRCLRYSERKVSAFGSRKEVLLKLLPLLDEVVRREVAIILAMRRGNFNEAEKLRNTRSRRGKLLVELKEATQEDRLTSAAAIKAEFDRLRSQRADYTAEVGDYDPDLDQDPWYKPAR